MTSATAWCLAVQAVISAVKCKDSRYDTAGQFSKETRLGIASLMVVVALLVEIMTAGSAAAAVAAVEAWEAEDLFSVVFFQRGEGDDFDGNGGKWGRGSGIGVGSGDMESNEGGGGGGGS